VEVSTIVEDASLSMDSKSEIVLTGRGG
jgi:hypothetical protein